METVLELISFVFGCIVGGSLVAWVYAAAHRSEDITEPCGNSCDDHYALDTKLRNYTTKELLRYVDRSNPEVRELAERLEMLDLDRQLDKLIV